MSEAPRLRELEAMARRLANGMTDHDARMKLLEYANELATQIKVLEAEDAPKDEPPLAAS